MRRVLLLVLLRPRLHPRRPASHAAEVQHPDAVEQPPHDWHPQELFLGPNKYSLL
jgi:hypothetical protein